MLVSGVCVSSSVVQTGKLDRSDLDLAAALLHRRTSTESVVRGPAVCLSQKCTPRARIASM